MTGRQGWGCGDGCAGKQPRARGQGCMLTRMQRTFPGMPGCRVGQPMRCLGASTRAKKIAFLSVKVGHTLAAWPQLETCTRGGQAARVDAKCGMPVCGWDRAPGRRSARTRQTGGCTTTVARETCASSGLQAFVQAWVRQWGGCLQKVLRRWLAQSKQRNNRKPARLWRPCAACRYTQWHATWRRTRPPKSW